VTFIFLALLATASAQEEACPGAYVNDNFVTDLDAVDDAFRAFDLDGARAQLSAAHRNLLCIEERADPSGIARMSRQLALAFFLDQDIEALTRWAILSRELQPDLPWYADMDSEHPFRVQFQQVEMPERAGPAAALVPPKKGGYFWNGRFTADPQLPIEMPGLVQAADKSGAWIKVWWQDGSAWPDHTLGPVGPAPAAPRWLTEPTSDPRHAARARQGLFSEAEAPVEEPRTAEPAYSDSEIASAKQEDVAGTYRDPFEDARRRAIRREYFETTSTNESGDQVTVKTEVVTYKRDRSAGQPITYEIFYYWLRDNGSWEAGAAVDAGMAVAGYLGDWQGGKPPPNTSRSPLVWVSQAAAESYCGSYGVPLAAAEGPPIHDDLKWEWRASAGKAVRVNAKGKINEADPGDVFEDTGFRCHVQ